LSRKAAERLRLDARQAMSGTRRTPLTRPPVGQITPRAIDLYESMGKLKCTCPSPKPPTQGPCPGCSRWYDLHDDLHTELGCRPWEWPCVARQSPKRAGSTCMSESIAATMTALDEAACLLSSPRTPRS
jgi:hypothetical protein